MDVRIEATAMVAEALVITPMIMRVSGSVNKVIPLIERVASFVRLSRGGTSLSAVSPDYILIGGTA